MPFGDGFEALIDGLYEAAVIPERWQGWLTGLARDCDATAALCSRISETRLSVVSTSAAFKEMWDEIWLAQGGAQNERTKRAIALRHAGFVTDADVFAPGEAEQLPLYRDFLIPRGYGSGAATTITIPSGDIAVLNVEKPYAEGPFPREIVAVLDRVRPPSRPLRSDCQSPGAGARTQCGGRAGTDESGGSRPRQRWANAHRQQVAHPSYAVGPG